MTQRSNGSWLSWGMHPLSLTIADETKGMISVKLPMVSISWFRKGAVHPAPLNFWLKDLKGFPLKAPPFSSIFQKHTAQVSARIALLHCPSGFLSPGTRKPTKPSGREVKWLASCRLRQDPQGLPQCDNSPLTKIGSDQTCGTRVSFTWTRLLGTGQDEDRIRFFPITKTIPLQT